MNSERNEQSEPRQRHKYTQPREQLLRGRILDSYPSLRRFALDAGIPYSTLMTLLTRGVDSATMLDIILGSVRFDFANLYNLANINAIFYKGIQTGVNTFMSDYEAKRSALETEFEKTMATFDTNTTG